MRKPNPTLKCGATEHNRFAVKILNSCFRRNDRCNGRNDRLGNLSNQILYNNNGFKKCVTDTEN
ncbi:MAG: hypothetical protein K8S87_00940 [Planctomycetes bacterium]|nr:hypothetical protein [Planctomycetota bacterium]